MNRQRKAGTYVIVDCGEVRCLDNNNNMFDGVCSFQSVCVVTVRYVVVSAVSIRFSFKILSVVLVLRYFYIVLVLRYPNSYEP